jgi:hypothetical protein
MPIDWVTQIHTFVVEHREIPRPANRPYFLNSSTLIGVLHTTEGTTVNGAWTTLNAAHSAPHFIAGENRIVQCRPLTVQGAALRSGNGNTANVHAQVQIEMVARSREQLWQPAPATLGPTVAIIAFCAKNLGIPLRIPNNWPDDVSDMPLPWARNNRRRKQAAQLGLWPVEKGWWMHMEVPYQGPSWHWDCGALQRSTLLNMAAILAPTLTTR